MQNIYGRLSKSPIESNSGLWQRNRIGGGGNTIAYAKSPEATYATLLENQSDVLAYSFNAH